MGGVIRFSGNGSDAGGALFEACNKFGGSYADWDQWSVPVEYAHLCNSFGILQF